MPDQHSLTTRLSRKQAEWLANRRLAQLTRQMIRNVHIPPGKHPVVLFNASTRLTGLSLNAAFAFLTACGMQLAGTPVVYFACRSGLSRCVLGTDPDDHTNPPPCAGCIAQAQRLFAHAPTVWFDFSPDEALAKELSGLNLAELSEFEYDAPFTIRPLSAGPSPRIPLGPLTLPSLRWALRRHHLSDDEPTRYLLGQYILSAQSFAGQFANFLDQVEPAAVVLFNGILYPEATARWVAQHYSIRTVTHEVGFTPFSAFFSHGDATAYPISIPEDFELSPEQNARLDAYLEQRFMGNFTMAGIRFWPEMRSLDEDFSRRAEKFRQIVPVFTNVIYDTSQVHANALFPNMFAWLEQVLELIRTHPETLFVIRAHPDEIRAGKQSRESVEEWVAHNRVAVLPNVIFVKSQDYLSSYELIQRSKFVMVYNSSIGLEATLMGVAVLCGGQARYTQYPTVFFPQTSTAYYQIAKEFLAAAGPVAVPVEFVRQARRFLYYQLFRASLPFGDFIESFPLPGYVQLRNISWRQLDQEVSTTIRVIVEGILNGKPFLLPES